MNVLNDNIPVINVPVMKQMIHHYGVVKRRPLYFHGPSGVGKSEGVMQSSVEHGAVLVDIRTSQWEGIDFRGLPENYRHVDTRQLMTEWSIPGPLPFKGNPRFNEDGPPIYLFLDEFPDMELSTAAVCYQLVNDRRSGDHELMDNVVIIAAGNLGTDRGASRRVPSPLNNRFQHAQLVPDVKAFSAEAARRGKSPMMVAFLNFCPELLHTFDSDKPEVVFATSRSWMKVADDIDDPDIPPELKPIGISGLVGQGPATQLFAFARIRDSLKPIEEIIKDPTGTPVPRELDVQWAMAAHVAGNMNKDNADALHQYLARMEAEMTVMAWTMAINKDEDITDTNAFLFSYAPTYRGLFQS